MSQTISFISRNSISYCRIKELIKDYFKDYEIWWSPDGYEVQLTKLEAGMIWFRQFSMDDREGREIELDQYRDSEELSDDFASSLEDAEFFYCTFGLYSNMREFLGRILKLLKDDLDDIWINNQFWNIFSGRAFLYYLESEDRWDWRQDFGTHGTMPDPPELNE